MQALARQRPPKIWQKLLQSSVLEKNQGTSTGKCMEMWCKMVQPKQFHSIGDIWRLKCRCELWGALSSTAPRRWTVDRSLLELKTHPAASCHLSGLLDGWKVLQRSTSSDFCWFCAFCVISLHCLFNPPNGIPAISPNDGFSGYHFLQAWLRVVHGVALTSQSLRCGKGCVFEALEWSVACWTCNIIYSLLKTFQGNVCNQM